ncbi:hypothetical protein AAFF_G00016520 [Aldrovandia affinis]|uniref:Uncharacterized protein n=1 Tax=Aldrovandia affinis TaxID=143900 RepID=A0AAD7S5Y5_9TELE|nr:hypothetical protein AAFF_G00016520 [Aldrovandia affinis]
MQMGTDLVRDMQYENGWKEHRRKRHREEQMTNNLDILFRIYNRRLTPHRLHAVMFRTTQIREWQIVIRRIRETQPGIKTVQMTIRNIGEHVMMTVSISKDPHAIQQMENHFPQNRTDVLEMPTEEEEEEEADERNQELEALRNRIGELQLENRNLRRQL